MTAPPPAPPSSKSKGGGRSQLALSAATLFVSFVPRQPANQAGPAAHVDHIRTTSIPSNHGTFTHHLHINAYCDGALRRAARGQSDSAGREAGCQAMRFGESRLSSRPAPLRAVTPTSDSPRGSGCPKAAARCRLRRGCGVAAFRSVRRAGGTPNGTNGAPALVGCSPMRKPVRSQSCRRRGPP